MELQLVYDCDRSALVAELAEAFVTLRQDAESMAFLAKTRPHGAFSTALFRGLRLVMADYDAYGLLGMYRMQLLSLTQWRTLLDLPSTPQPSGALLDVGAGRGDVTACLTPYFATNMAIEPSTPLRRHLPARGFGVLARDLCHEALPADLRFDLITCLNVIDRVAYPKTLLSHLRSGLSAQGRMVIAVPLPLKPHVDRGGSTVAQEEPLPRCEEENFEIQAASLVEELIRPLGLQVTRMARAPYLCQGDAERPLYMLDDAIFVCQRARL